MSAKVDLISKNTVWRTSVHRFVRMRFLYFTNTVFENWHFTALARWSHHQRIKNCFRYVLSTTIISHRSPSFTSAGVLRALANPKVSIKTQLQTIATIPSIGTLQFTSIG